jgi:hypothetical protein
LSCPVDAVQTFVVRLVTESAAQYALGADPVAALAASGLTDLTPADLREALPAVADHIPAPLADALESSLHAVPAGDGAGGVPAVVAQLQALVTTAQDWTAPAFGGELPVYTSVLDTFPPSDPDPGALATATGGSAEGVAASGYYTGAVTGTTTVVAGPGGAVVSLAGDTAPGSQVGSGITVAGNGHSGAFAATGDSALGSYTVAAAGSPAVPSLGAAADLAHSLDSLVLGKAEYATNAAAGAVSTGGDLVAGSVATGSQALGGYLTNGGAIAGHAVASGGAELGGHLTASTTTAADTITQGPAIPALPAPALPDHLPTPAATHVTDRVVHDVSAHSLAPEATLFSHEATYNAMDAGVSHSPLAMTTASFAHAVDVTSSDAVHSGHGELLLGH